MILAGRDVGAFALLVGVEDADMERWLPKASGPMDHLDGRYGVLDIYLRSAKKRGITLALENLGDSLHPSKHAPLVASLRASGVPVIATTHAPDLVDCAAFDEVFVCAGDTVRCLAEHPEAAYARRMMRAGQFWNTTGEAWVTE